MGVRQEEILLVRAGERRKGPPTPGMDRQEAFATEGLWAGLIRTEPGMVSGWHHHGEYETAIYVLTGSLRMEFGPSGANTVDAGPGDFVYVPEGVVHREQSRRGALRSRWSPRGSWGVHVQRRRAGVT